MCHSIKAQYPEAIREYQTARTMNPESTPALTGLGVAYAKSGNRLEALKTVHSMETMARQTYVSPVYIGLIYGALGDRDKEFSLYEKGYDDQSEWLLWLTLDPLFDDVRPNPRFQALIRRVGLAK
jgi:adenylate cyclase